MIYLYDLSSTLTDSFSEIYLSLFSISTSEILLKSYLWHLLIIVSGTLWVSVVASINFTCFGGSSNILRSALNAHLESICTSSTIYILYLVFIGENWALSIISLILSTQVWLAASISMISTKLSSAKDLQISHSKHGFPSFELVQFIVFARSLAVEVFPVHLGQHNK